MRIIQGYTIFASHHNANGSVVILGAVADSRYKDAFRYVVATLEKEKDNDWPSGQYFYTLELAVDIFNRTYIQGVRDTLARLLGEP